MSVAHFRVTVTLKPYLSIFPLTEQKLSCKPKRKFQIKFKKKYGPFKKPLKVENVVFLTPGNKKILLKFLFSSGNFSGAGHKIEFLHFLAEARTMAKHR